MSSWKIFAAGEGSLRLGLPRSWGADSQGFHLAVQVAALEAQQFGGAGDVAVGLFEGLQDVITLLRLAEFQQAAETVGGALRYAR